MTTNSPYRAWAAEYSAALGLADSDSYRTVVDAFIHNRCGVSSSSVDERAAELDALLAEAGYAITPIQASS